MTEEKYIKPFSAYIVLIIHFILFIFSLILFIPDSFGPFAIFLLGIALVMIRGYYVNPTNHATVFTLFGTYQSTSLDNGFFWMNPFFKREKVSLKIHSIKVEKEIMNEAVSKKIRVSAIINWKINTPSKALFETEDYAEFVNLQSEATLTEITNTTLYDIINEKSNVLFMPDKNTVVHQLFEKNLKDKLNQIGIEVLETKVG